MIFFDKINDKGESVANNFNGNNKTCLKEMIFQSPNGVLKLYTDDENLLKSKKTFRKVGRACVYFFESIYKYFIDQFVLHTHDLKSIQAKLEQSIEGIVQNLLLSKANSYQEQKDLVLQKVKSEPEFTADTLIYLQKRILALDAHMSSFEILHMGGKIKIDKKRVNVRKLILNIWHGFEEDFIDKEINLHFMFNKEFAEEHKINLDYKTISAALYNLFDNGEKYIQHGTEIKIYLNTEKKEFELIFSMMSLRIEKEELIKLFNLGYRGSNSHEYEGYGAGMFIFKRAMELNNFAIKIEPDYSVARKEDGKQFILNKFIVTGQV